MKRILVVEDEQAIREMVGFALKKAGFQFEQVDDARRGERPRIRSGGRRRRLWDQAVLVLVAVLLGALFGSIALALLLTLGCYLAWHLYNLQRLLRWLREGKKLRPPEASGIWDDVFEHIFRLQQRNRKRDLRRLLKRFHKITVALPDARVELRPGSDEIVWLNNAAAHYLGF